MPSYIRIFQPHALTQSKVRRFGLRLLLKQRQEQRNDYCQLLYIVCCKVSHLPAKQSLRHPVETNTGPYILQFSSTAYAMGSLSRNFIKKSGGPARNPMIPSSLYFAVNYCRPEGLSAWVYPFLQSPVVRTVLMASV